MNTVYIFIRWGQNEATDEMKTQSLRCGFKARGFVINRMNNKVALNVALSVERCGTLPVSYTQLASKLTLCALFINVG